MVNKSKPRLLIFPFDLLSHYLRCLVLARFFKPYFEILFAHSENYADFISNEGFKTFHCKTFNASDVMENVKTFDFSWLNEAALESVFLDQVRVIEAIKPVAVLSDTSPTLKMAAEKTGVMYLSLMNGYMSKYYAFTRKMSDTHPVAKYINFMPEHLLNLLTKKGEEIAFIKLHRPFKKIRSAYHLSKKINYLDELEGDINLVCDLVALFPQKLLPGNYIVIAPLYFETSISYSQITHRLHNKKKTIFVTMGSTGDWQKFTFLNNHHFSKYNIVTAGDSGNVLNAVNIIRVTFINIHELFHETDLVICHGGNGIIYQSLLYGIPILCKTNNFEQEWNVDALERLKAGKLMNNICDIRDYIRLVEEWIERKGAGCFEYLEAQIKTETGKLEYVISGLAASLLPCDKLPAELPNLVVRNEITH